MNKLFTYILIGLLLIVAGFALWLWFNPKIDKVYVQIKPKPEIIYTNKPDGGTIATIETQIADLPAETLSQDYIKYVNDTLVPALNKGLQYKAEVSQLTRINAALKDSLTKANINAKNARKDVIEWQTKYITIAANPKDSTINYAYNAQLDIAEYSTKETLFGDKKTYISVTSPDKNFRINGVENFTKPVKVPKDFVELNVKLNGIYLDKTLTPYMGAELMFNPDGRLKPAVGYGYFYTNGILIPYWSAGMQLNLIRF